MVEQVEQDHKQDALDSLHNAEVIAGADGNSLNSSPAQADYFLQKGLIHAILHLADVFSVENSLRMWDSVLGDDEDTVLKDDGANSFTAVDGTAEPAMMLPRPSPTMTILTDDGEESAPVLPASSIEANQDLDPEDATTSEESF